jgi:uncharacterized protein (TIGR02268 family)
MELGPAYSLEVGFPVLPLSHGSLLTLALLAGTAGATELHRDPECATVLRIDLTAKSAEQAPGVCVNLGAPTTFVFGAPLPPGAAVLFDSRSLSLAQGDNFFTVYPKRGFLVGERVKLTVRFGDGAAPEEAAFWLVGHSAQGARSVEVFRSARSADALQREATEARAEASHCQEEKAQLLAESTAPGGLMGAAWLERTGEIHSKDILLDLEQHSDDALTVEAARSYSHSGSVVVRLRLLNISSNPWMVSRAVLKSSMGVEVELSLWQGTAIPVGELGFVVVGAQVDVGQLNCPCTLELRENQNNHVSAFGKVVFPVMANQ